MIPPQEFPTAGKTALRADFQQLPDARTGRHAVAFAALRLDLDRSRQVQNDAVPPVQLGDCGNPRDLEVWRRVGQQFTLQKDVTEACICLAQNILFNESHRLWSGGTDMRTPGQSHFNCRANTQSSRTADTNSAL